MNIANRYMKKYPAVRKRVRVYAPAVKQLASDVMYLKGIINSEPHIHTVQSANNFNYAGIIVSLCNVPVGDDSNNRTGERLLPRYLSINLQFGASSAYASTYMHIRYIIFRYWGEASSAAATVTPSEVLSTTGSAYAAMSHLNPDNTGSKRDRSRRIEVLRSELLSVCKGNDTGQHCKMINIEMNGKNTNSKEHIQFRNNVTGEPISGGIYILFINDTAGATDGAYQLESKLTFYDN